MINIPEIIVIKMLFDDIDIVYHDHQVTPVSNMRTCSKVRRGCSKICRGWRTMWKNLEGDRAHVVILIFLYCLQGIPLGDVNTVFVHLQMV